MNYGGGGSNLPLQPGPGGMLNGPGMGQGVYSNQGSNLLGQGNPNQQGNMGMGMSMGGANMGMGGNTMGGYGAGNPLQTSMPNSMGVMSGGMSNNSMGNLGMGSSNMGMGSFGGNLPNSLTIQSQPGNYMGSGQMTSQINSTSQPPFATQTFTTSTMQQSVRVIRSGPGIGINYQKELGIKSIL